MPHPVHTMHVDQFTLGMHYVCRWILSKAKKDNVDEAVSKYDGEYWKHVHRILVSFCC